MRRPVGRLLWTGLAAIAVALVGLLALVLSSPAPPPLPLPNPNGHDDFVRAGKLISGDFSGYRELSEEKLRSMLATNAEVLRLTRVGLSRQCLVPPDFSPGFSRHLPELPAIKHLAVVLAAEGRLAEMENRPRDAAKSYLDGLKLGVEAARGGVIIHALVGVAIEAIHIAPLEKLGPKLDAEAGREVAAALDQVESNREPISTLLRRERQWARKTYGLRGEIVRLYTWRSIRKTEQGLATRLSTQQTRNRLLLVQVAARAYEKTTGHPPNSLADLVPGYLHAIPLDPRTGTNMVFAP